MCPSSWLKQVLAEVQQPAATTDPHEPTYLSALWLGLTGAERTQAEDAVVARIAAHGDVRAMRTAEVLGLGRAATALETWADPAHTPDVSVRSAAALALGKIRGDLAALDQALASPLPMTRHEATKRVAKIGTVEAWGRLRAMLTDSHPFVRRSAALGLVEAFGLRRYAFQSGDAPGSDLIFQSPLGRMALAIASDVEPLWRSGAAELGRLFAEISDGKSPVDLGLAYVPSADPTLVPRFLASVEAAEGPLDGDAVRGMTGHDRAWAEAFLTVRLERGFRDARIPSALHDLLGMAAAPALAWASATLPVGHVTGDAARALQP